MIYKWLGFQQCTVYTIMHILKENTDTFVIIIAHADSKGDADYNKVLSHERANSVKQYFEKNGIKITRIVARGLGEELLINECHDGINCEENDHSINRRAEIKIQYLVEEEAVDY